MPSWNYREVAAVPVQLVVAGVDAAGPLSATRFLPAKGDQSAGLRVGPGPLASGGFRVFVQLATPKGADKQTHDEQLISRDEQWSSRREQLAAPGRCPTVTI